MHFGSIMMKKKMMICRTMSRGNDKHADLMHVW